MPDATSESRKRSRSPSADGDRQLDQHHHKRLNVGTDAEHPRVEPVAAPSITNGDINSTEDTLMESAEGVGAAAGTDISMLDAGGDAAAKDSAFKQMVHMRCLIMTQDASVIIGKGGAHIAEIRKKSGARVLVSEAVPGNPERILNISGQLEAVAKAFGLIARRMNDEPFDTTSGPTSRAVTIRLAIPHQRMGSVIGKGGVKIKEIQDQSGAQLKASEGVLPNSTERILNIVGVADAIHIATYHVGNVMLEAQKVHGATNNALYRPAPPGMFPPGAGGPPGQFNRPGPQGNMGGPGFNGPPMPFNGGVAAGYPNFNGAPGPQGPRPGPVPMAVSGPMGPYGNAGPAYPQGVFPPQQQQQQRPPFMNGPAGPGVYGMGPQPAMQFGGPGATMGGAVAPITQEVSVPADLIGTIIGKGGSKINELRQVSASNIKVLDPAPGPAGAGAPRRVTISGAPPNVHMAVNLLNQRLQFERQKQMRNNTVHV